MRGIGDCLWASDIRYMVNAFPFYWMWSCVGFARTLQTRNWHIRFGLLPPALSLSNFNAKKSPLQCHPEICQLMGRSMQVVETSPWLRCDLNLTCAKSFRIRGFVICPFNVVDLGGRFSLSLHRYTLVSCSNTSRWYSVPGEWVNGAACSHSCRTTDMTMECIEHVEPFVWPPGIYRACEFDIKY